MRKAGDAMVVHVTGLLGPQSKIGLEHGGVWLQWLGEVLLCITYGHFDYEAAVQVSKDMMAAASARPASHWRLLVITSSGSISTPDATIFFAGLTRFFRQNGCTHSALLNAFVVQDAVYDKLFSDAGICTSVFRDLEPAVRWLQEQGCVLRIEEVREHLQRKLQVDRLHADLPEQPDI